MLKRLVELFLENGIMYISFWFGLNDEVRFMYFVSYEELVILVESNGLKVCNLNIVFGKDGL